MFENVTNGLLSLFHGPFARIVESPDPNVSSILDIIVLAQGSQGMKGTGILPVRPTSQLFVCSSLYTRRGSTWQDAWDGNAIPTSSRHSILAKRAIIFPFFCKSCSVSFFLNSIYPFLYIYIYTFYILFRKSSTNPATIPRFVELADTIDLLRIPRDD